LDEIENKKKLKDTKFYFQKAQRATQKKMTKKQGVNIRSNPGVNVQNNLGDAEMGKKREL